MRLAAIQRFPVKGLGPDTLSRVQLEAGGWFPGDRIFAIENGPSGFDPQRPAHRPKLAYLMLMKHAALARLTPRWDEAARHLAIADDNGTVIAGQVDDPEDCARIGEAIAARLPADDLRGPARLLVAPDGFRFTDSPQGYVSLINLASVSDLGTRMGQPIDPLRFRGNLLLDGLAPWTEFNLVGQTLAGPGGLKLEVTARIDRCAATSVNPVTAERDAPVVRALMSAFGHVDCGVYARIVSSGTLAVGQRFNVVAPAPARDFGLG
jgi:uncharacterized protein YcbX